MFYRSIPVQESFDLNDVCRGDGFLFVRDGIGHAGRGIVATGTEIQIRDILSNISASTYQNPAHEAPKPIAFGLVPFLPSENSTFFIPEVVFSKHTTSTQFFTVVSHDDDLTDAKMNELLQKAVKSSTPQPSSAEFAVKPLTAVNEYLSAVANARDAVAQGQLDKVVIARDISVSSSTALQLHGILLRLRASFGSSYRYCVGNMIGASPELLIEVSGRQVRSHPLAGTAPRTGDPATDKKLADDLISSTKNQIEHRVVIDMVHDTLLPYCSYLDWEPEPSIVTVANVQHLGTAIEGALTEPTAHVFDLVKTLSPTPALGGHPSAQALQFIDEHEPMTRGFYGGAVGWMNADGDGTFAVTIRCAEISQDKKSARLFAGGGIVAESEPLSELAETQAKFQAMLSAIVRP